MAILTREELEARIGPEEVAVLASRTTSYGEDAGAVDAALADAEAEVLSYVRVVTPAPLPDPAPETLRRIAAVVARYNLHRRSVPEDHPALIAYRDAVKELRDIAAGRIALPLPGTEANAATAGAGASYAPSRSFTDTVMARMLPGTC